MNSIDFRQANELLNLDLVDLESCFDSLFYPPEDFDNTSDNQRKENSPFACMEEHKKMMPCTTVLSADPNAKGEVHMDRQGNALVAFGYEQVRNG